MEETKSMFNVKGYAQKEILKEDLSLRIAEAINATGALYDNLVNAQVTIEYPVELIDELKESKKHYDSAIGELKTLARQKCQRLEAELAAIEPKKERKINRDVFNYFITAFYQLYLASKDQIKGNKSKVSIGKERHDVKDLVEVLFQKVVEGNMPVEYSMKLFSLYLNSLAQSGIYDLTFQSLKPQETWRHSV